MARVELDIVNDELRTAVRERLEHAGHMLGPKAPEVVLTDDTLRAMEHLKRGPTLVLANLDELGAALAAMRAGAYHYVLVPLQPGELELQVERAALGLVPPHQGRPLPLADIEARYLRAVLKRFRGNQTKAARALGIGRNTLWRKLKQYEDPNRTQLQKAMHTTMKTTLADAIQQVENQPIKACHVGTGAAERLAAFASEHLGHSGLIVADENTLAAGGDKVLSALDGAGKRITQKTYGPDPLDATEELGNEVASAGQDRDFFVAIGSGTLCDLVKHAGTVLNKPAVLYATAVSMNGYTSGITALKVRGLKRTTPCTPAVAVFADPQVVATAPQRMAAAGVADFLSKCSAASDWRTAHLLRNEYYSPKAMAFYEGAVAEVLDAAPGVGRAEPEALAVALEALLLSGLSMLAAGSSSPASGGEHLLSHYLDMKSALYGSPHDLHGAQVGVGTVHCLGLWKLILSLEPGTLDADALVAAQPDDAEIKAWIEEDWSPAVAAEVVAQWHEKALPPEKLRDEIARFKTQFDPLREGIRKDYLPPDIVAAAIKAAGGPVTADELDAPTEEFEKAIKRARFIRNRFTVLDLATELGIA